MAVSQFKVRINHSSGVARVEGLLVKVVLKPNHGPPKPDRFRRSVCDYQLAALVAGPPAFWEVILKLPTGKGKKGVVAYDIEIVMLDASNQIVDSFCRRRKKPLGIIFPPIVVRKPRPIRTPTKA